MDIEESNSSKSPLQALAKLMFGLAALLFFFGGRAIHEFWGVERLLAEIFGIGLAVICGLAGAVFKHFAEDV
jgi:hypothetical protein